MLPRDAGRATELLYKRHGDTVFRYAWHLLGRREDAEDATQATFLAVHRALAGGTAVLDSGAWVVRIARNECMGRLRQTARRPAVSLDDGFDAPAAGGVERSAEVRDEMRTARQTLVGLPEPERAAFVLREWLGLEAGEAALALGLTAGNVDGLASRARRSLVLAVGGLEPAIGCTDTRTALEAGTLHRAAKVHLLRCPVCRGVRRALRPPEAAMRPAIAQRLSAVIPGFASGGGILAALMAKATAAPVLAKTAAIVVAAVAAGGAAEQAIVGARTAHHGKSHGGQAKVAAATSPALARGDRSTLVALITPRRTTRASASPLRPAARGAAAVATGRLVSAGSGDDRREHGGRTRDQSGRDDGGGSMSGKHSSGGAAASSDSRDGSGSAHASSDSASGTFDGGDVDSVNPTATSDDGSSSGSGKDSGSSTSGGDDLETHGADSGELAPVATVPATTVSGSD